ncbi:hypothetical protein B296_00026365, partial [Ensete ventricosum]
MDAPLIVSMKGASLAIPRPSKMCSQRQRSLAKMIRTQTRAARIQRLILASRASHSRYWTSLMLSFSTLRCRKHTSTAAFQALTYTWMHSRSYPIVVIHPAMLRRSSTVSDGSKSISQMLLIDRMLLRRMLLLIPTES